MKQLRKPYSRYRTQVETPGQIGYLRLRMYKPNAGYETAHSEHPSFQKQSSTYMHDVVTPGFAQRAASGEIVNNPMSKVSTLYGSSTMLGGEFDRTGNDVRWAADGDAAHFIGFIEPSGGLVNVTNLVHLSQTSALAGVKAPDLYTGVALGELHKTLTLAVSPIRSLSKLLANSANAYRRDLRLYGNPLNSVMKIKGHTKRHKRLVELKRKMRDARKRDPIDVNSLEFIPDMVLAYNLGWKPILMDIDALLHKIPEKLVYERQTSRAMKTDESASTLIGEHAVSPGGRFAYTDTITEKVTVRSGVLYETGYDNPRADFGTRLADVPITVWELVPFSFLLDYAANIGDYLEASVASSRARILAFYTKITSEIEVTRSLTQAVANPGWTVTRHCQGSLGVKHVAISRDNSPFGAHIAHTPITLANRPAAQLQNVLSLLTKTLYGASVWKTR